MPTKKILREKNLEEISEKFMEKILNMFNQKAQDASRNFKTPKIKNMRRHKNK
jgi:ribosomal protein L29